MQATLTSKFVSGDSIPRNDASVFSAPVSPAGGTCQIVMNRPNPSTFRKAGINDLAAFLGVQMRTLGEPVLLSRARERPSCTNDMFKRKGIGVARITHVKTHDGATLSHAVGVTDMTIHHEGGETHLVTTTGAEGGAMVLNIGVDGQTELIDQIAFTPSELVSGDAQVELVTDGTATYVVSYGQMDRQLTAHALQGATDLGDAQALTWSGPGAGGSLKAMHTVTVGGTDYVYTSSIGTTGLAQYQLTQSRQMQLRSSQTVQAELPDAVDIVDFASIEANGTCYLLAASQLHQGVVCYELDAEGNPTRIDMVGAADGIGISNPTVVECLNVGEQPFVVVAAAGSSSLTVMKLLPDGSLTQVDHIIDNLNTRFDAVTEMEVVEVNGHCWTALKTRWTPRFRTSRP